MDASINTFKDKIYNLTSTSNRTRSYFNIFQSSYINQQLFCSVLCSWGIQEQFANMIFADITEKCDVKYVSIQVLMHYVDAYC